MLILLIAGGWSSEREVSLAGAKIIQQGLSNLGHQVTFFDLGMSLNGLLPAAKEHDFAFINLHGSPGEDGLIQAMLESVGCPYQGSDPRSSFLALNKSASKEIFKNVGLTTPDWIFLPYLPPKPWSCPFALPVFVKANTGGSSLFLNRAETKEELWQSLNDIFAVGEEVIIEPLISGVEVTCGILGEKALPPILILPNQGTFFNYNSKYEKGGAKEICPAPLPKQITEQVQEFSLKAHKALGLKGYSRADFILTEDNTVFLLEINTLPGMTATSLLPQEAAAIGLSFEQLLQELINLGLKSE